MRIAQPRLRRHLNAAFTLCALLGVAGLGSGCAEIVRSSPDEVSVDTQSLGTIMPGTRQWLGWLAANQHCNAQGGRSPEVKDLQGSLAIYRCVED